ncbi:Beta-chimaerin, partial [Fasciola gigantica]
SVPTILVRCIEEIEGRGALEFEGLYRIPGNHERVDQVRAAFDKDSEAADISVNRIPDVNIITSLIKSFLRQLPVPLITYEAYTDFIDVIRDEQMKDDERLNAIRKLLTRLPPAHYESLRFFMQHIHKVAQHRDVNMMSAENLAIVLSPSLMTSSYSDPISCMVGTRSEHALVERMIKDFDFLFPVTEIPVRRVPQTDSRSTGPSVNNNSKRNSQIVPAPVSPSTTSSQLGYVKRKFLRNRRSVDTPLLAAAAATITGTNTTSNERVASPTPATPPSSAVAVSFSMNTAL